MFLQFWTQAPIEGSVDVGYSFQVGWHLEGEGLLVNQQQARVTGGGVQVSVATAL